MTVTGTTVTRTAVRVRTLVIVATALVAFAISWASRPSVVWAAGGSSDSGTRALDVRPENPDYTAAVKAIKAGDYPTAIKLLQGVVARDDKNADAYNWLAYATRKNGDASAAIPLYEKALAINPKHRGAHEYIGEAYLVLGDLPKAKAHLARLDSLCFLPCSEYRELKEAVEAYEKSGGKVKPTASR
jgi:tetratricopeptide (TPR) repeat protein